MEGNPKFGKFQINFTLISKYVSVLSADLNITKSVDNVTVMESNYTDLWINEISLFQFNILMINLDERKRIPLLNFNACEVLKKGITSNFLAKRILEQLMNSSNFITPKTKCPIRPVSKDSKFF